MSDATLHADSIVIDAVAPLLRVKKNTALYAKGGVTAVCPTVSIEDSSGPQVKALGAWLEHIRTNPTLVHATSTEDIRQAKRDGKLAIVFHFQGTDSLENDLNLANVYHALGVRMIQLTYNVKNRVGDGCTERTDAGLSNFGLRLIQRMNELGVVVDCSHTGFRTTMEAIEASKKPVVFSHANAKAVFDTGRNIVEEQAKAIAKTNGLIGVNIVPYFLVREIRPTIDMLIDHIDYYKNLIGIDHIGIGFDYFNGQQPFVSDEEALAIYQQNIDSGRWDPRFWPKPTQLYPEGLDTPEHMHNLAPALKRRGYSDADVKKVLGENWMRVFKDNWGK